MTQAEDIDIYAENAASSGIPNVLFVIDNGANFSASAGAACNTYAAGGIPSLGSTGAGVEQCALVDVIQALPVSSVNIGILVGNANNFARGYGGSAGDAAYYTPCDQSTGYGGCVVWPLAEMTQNNKDKLVAFIKAWKISGSDSATEFNVKAGGNKTGNMMQEAWAYYNGKQGMSGRTYSRSELEGCQKNFVIFIANAAGVNGDPADTPTGTNLADPSNSTNGLKSLQAAATIEQKAIINEVVTYKTMTCGVTSMSTTAGKADNWADEWARLMEQQDGSAEYGGSQNIVTYGIGIVSNSCVPDYPTLLTSMAKHGGGKYFQTSSAAEVTDALNRVLNEIQSVNSVFASASLPVSVNAQGTYLNQIFLGMFRPDGSANPRWLGNLKQYQFVLDGTDPNTAKLKLGDSTGAEALSSAGTGFIKPDAISFWTTKDTTKTPDNLATGGFFINEPNPVSHGHYDLPDGELVERGAAAQQLRIESLTANFAATARSSTNPRRLYTYCPSSSGCVAAITDSSNAFAIENSGIVAASLGDSTTIKINTIERTGTSALVTTSGDHGLTGTPTVTISNASPSDYNVTQAVTVNGARTFTITGLNDFPTTPSQGTYQISTVGGSPISIASITRPGSAGAANSQTATVTTSATHNYVAGNVVSITGATPTEYSGDKTIISVPTTTSITFSIPVYPTTPAVNTYQAVISPTAYPSQAVTMTNPATGTVAGTTAAAHNFHVGQWIVISGTGNGFYNGSAQILTVTSTTFTASKSVQNKPTKTGSVVVDPTPKPISLTRSEGASVTTATVTGAPVKWFGTGIGSTKVANIAKVGGSSTNETAYEKSNVTITCVDADCTSFTYPITSSPALSAAGSMQVALPGAATASIAAGSISRSGNTGTVTGVTAGFTNNDQVTISSTGIGLSGESAYTGLWTIACTAPCATLTFGPLNLTPTTPATPVGNYMQAYAAGISPDKNTLVQWVRGHDNFGDELGPGGSITVRPSIHADVLHSRPIVINYGDSDRGLVVYYGSNDGVFHAVNGSQTSAITDPGLDADLTTTVDNKSIPPGGELWGLVLPEHFSKLNRQRVNSPELKLSVTSLADAQPKDYFVDGSVGSYQKLCGANSSVGTNCYGRAEGTIDSAYLYLSMRRGGQFVYALDVSNPTAPKFVWKIDASGTTNFVSNVQTFTSDTKFAEIGQTWSRPRITLVEGYPNPVLVFGAGYDPAEDVEPPEANSMGRGIFVVDALTGLRVWSAAYTVAGTTDCTGGSSTQGACAVTGMNWAIPSDISFVDRNSDGKTDRFYAPDVGGNVWRVDLQPTTATAPYTPDKWRVSKLAALGCDSGPCTIGTAPRKFFYPPNVVPVGATAAAGSYDAVMLGSGDREHPLISNDSHSVINRFYVLKDSGTGMSATGSVITEESLFNGGVVTGTTLTYDGTASGFYKTFAVGEKSVNASVTLRGTTYFGTNAPIVPIVTIPPTVDKSCKSNLGSAKGYALDPFKGTFGVTEFEGGGLPPSPTTGIVTILITNADGTTTSVKKEFCVGCGSGGTGSGADSKSSLGAGDPSKKVPKNARRTYWYKK